MMRRLAFVPFALLILGGCQSMPVATPTPIHGNVTDMPRFDAFIADRPTPDEFRATYPDVQLVLPGMAVTREYRNNHSRYFAQLDWQGRISNGNFM